MKNRTFVELRENLDIKIIILVMLENNYVFATNVPWGGGGDQSFKVILQVINGLYLYCSPRASQVSSDGDRHLCN